MDKYKHDVLKVAVGTIFHEKPKELKRLGESLSHLGIDYWFLIGGGFVDSPGDPRESDAVIDVIDDLENSQNENGTQGISIEYEYCDGSEFQKRMKYLDMCRIFCCNALLIVDSDEYVYENREWDFYTEWEKFRRYFYARMEMNPLHNIYSIRFIFNEYLGFDFHPRCWGHPYKMAYVQNSHYKFGNPEIDDVTDVLFTHQPSWGVIEGISLKHDHNLRTDDDMKNRRYYQDFLVKYEQYLERTDLTDGNPMAARRMALREMAPFEDNCMCMKCFKMKGMSVDQILDPRPRDKREKNPYLTGILL